jgi:hypothetical protein
MLRAGWIGGLVASAWLGAAVGAHALEPPADLPRYDLNVRIDPQNKIVRMHERVTWTNRSKAPVREIVFNVYPHYQLPEKDLAVVAKTIELLRESPSVALDVGGRCGDVERVTYLGKPVKGSNAQKPSESHPGPAQGESLPTYWRTDIDTALVAPLPEAVAPGESVVVEIDYALKLPDKQGRWGIYDGVVTLNHWFPTLAFHDDAGWQPTPFVPWHQPFFLEAGVYTARIALPIGQKLACSGPTSAGSALGEGWVQYESAPCVLRDFAVLASDRYEEHVGQIDGIALRVLALPEHAFFAQEMVRIAAEAIPAYTRWFGQFPYQHFTIAEGFFPWNGNECGALVMIDHRVFQMPHMGRGYVDYLVSHEILHQWWYNAVGTNGYAETWMDEGVATYFSHRLLNLKNGKNNALLEYPKGFGWMPNIHRENYRWYARAGSIRRGDQVPAVAPTMQDFGNVVGLFSGAYDRGSRLIGMIEERLGETATFDFFRLIYKKYYFRVLRVADFQRELEAYTGLPWNDYFANWVYGKGLTDWKIENVAIQSKGMDGAPLSSASLASWLPSFIPRPSSPNGYTVTVVLHQKAQIDEPTTVGFQFGSSDNYTMRVPVVPSVQKLTLTDPPALIESLPDHRVRVTVEVQEEPKQIAVDPDQVLEDAEPANNFWKPRERWRWTPLYTQLEESDMMNDYDRWNFIVGPWVYATASRDPWFQRSSYAGVRLGAIRTQQFSGGMYAAVRGDYRDVVIGVDGLIDHWPWSKTQVGFLAEQRVAGPIGGDGPDSVFRGVVYGRYIFQYTSALYLNPMHYAEVFGTYQDNPLPFARTRTPGAERPDNLAGAGLHYHKDYLTPYWDPEAGYSFDGTYMGGATDLPNRHDEPFHKIEAQGSIVKGLPNGLGCISDTRVAGRIAVAGAFPDEGQFFSLGGSQLLRGFDLAERQGSMLWLASAEWRVPVVRSVNWDVADHVAGLRSIWAVAFYDVGAVYANGRIVDDVAHSLGLGLRLDVAWFSFIERTVVRFDMAKTVNSDSPVQFWLGIQHAF